MKPEIIKALIEKPSQACFSIKKPEIKESEIARYQNATDETVKKLKERTEVIAVILYGSVARGDFYPGRSDIDLFVYIDSDKDIIDTAPYTKIAADIGTLFHLQIHIEVQSSKVQTEDQSLILKVAEEGKVWYNKNNIIIGDKIVGLKPYVLIKFSTKTNTLVERVKLARKLNGYKQKKDGKILLHKGLLDNETVYGIGKGALLAQKDKVDHILDMLVKYNVKYNIVSSFYKH